jgi:hypothetical protein
MKYPVKSGETKTMDVGVLSIEDPSWHVMLEFIQSETAIRKSDRNEPPTPTPSAASATTPHPSTTINFGRVKTIVATRVDVMQAGSRPLVPPFSLVLLTPDAAGRKMYEFLSWEEFRLDLRQFFLDELNVITLWLSLIAFVIGLLATGARWLLSRNTSIVTAENLIAKQDEPHPEIGPVRSSAS